MKLSQILENIRYNNEKPFNDSEIGNICIDSRKADKNSLFVCLKGENSDGHAYASNAYENGCRNFAAESALSLPEDANIVYTENTRKALAVMADNFFRHPQKELTVIGITGTKGKTSTAYMTASILKKAGKKVGIIGTVGTVFGDKFYKNTNSTPESLLIHKYFREMADDGIDTVIMEASSQGFKMCRTYGIIFDIAVFTNLYPDHIGEHEHADYNEYRDCKKIMFSQCKIGVFNKDDKETDYMEASSSCEKIIEFGIDNDSDFKAENIDYYPENGRLMTSFDLKSRSCSSRITIPHPGRASVYNSLCASAICSVFGIKSDVINAGLDEAVICGRNEIYNTKFGFSVVIDYAHNEMSTKSVYETLAPYRKGKIFTVFGCGGNRSKLRRYGMGDIVSRNSDFCVITTDNPRFEEQDDIASDIKKGITSPLGEVIQINDRTEAIKFCLHNAKKNDIVLVIGKGHEDYMEIKGVKYHYDDHETVEKLLSEMQQ